MLALEQATLARGGRRILDAVNLTVRPGRVTVLAGPNGAGKSTALALLAGRLRADSGRAVLDGRALQDWAPRALARRRAVLSQSVTLSFGFPVLQVALLGRSPSLSGASESPTDRQIAYEALRLVDAAHLAARNYLQLSGGEQRRVQLARVLAQVWDCREAQAYLLLDEPEAGLDIAHQHELLRLMRRLAGEGFGVCVVLHDLNLAARYADEVALFSAGRLSRSGVPETALLPEVLSALYGIALRRVPVSDDGDWVILPA